MKRSKVVVLTLASMSLGVTGCRREPDPVHVHNTAVIPPDALNPALRASLPAFVAGQDVSRQMPPHNAYDPQLGYYHQPCSAWFPYPYDYYDARWGYYRCGRWSRYHSTQAYASSSPYYRGGMNGFGTSSSTPYTSKPSTPPPVANDYAVQPAGAPVHTGVPQSHATTTRSAFTSRGGFGHTGFFSGWFSGS
jgi:hypothetical protein